MRPRLHPAPAGPVVGCYRQRYPQVVLELNSHEGHAGLLERRIDLAIRFGPLNDSSLRSRLAAPLTPADR
ncbi:MAG: LysR substrate-binding domain-containing protein, partial [Stenotrophomonas sp.]